MNTSSTSPSKTLITAEPKPKARKRMESASASTAPSWMSFTGWRSAKRSTARSTSCRPTLLLTIAPQPVSDHPLSQGLAGEQKAMLSGELFGRQRRPEIGIVLTHDQQCHRAHRRCRPPVARPPSLLGVQTHRARGAKLFQQPPHLALATPKQLRCRTHRQTTTIDVPQDLETPQLPIAHEPNRHPKHPPHIPGAVSSVLAEE